MLEVFGESLFEDQGGLKKVCIDLRGENENRTRKMSLAYEGKLQGRILTVRGKRSLAQVLKKGFRKHMGLLLEGDLGWVGGKWESHGPAKSRLEVGLVSS